MMSGNYPTGITFSRIAADTDIGRCQRYYEKHDDLYLSGYQAASVTVSAYNQYKTTKQGVPTIDLTVNSDSGLVAAASWDEKTAAADWVIRQEHKILSHDSKLWIMGGANAGTKYNDVWSSTDGITWTQATASAAWAARAKFTAVVHDSKMWVIGGLTASGRDNSVYSSTDGITWTQVRADGAADGFTAAHSHSSISHDGKLWVIGGDSGSNSDAVFSSTDGATWTQVRANNAANGFTNCLLHSSVSFDSKLWVIGGFTGSYLDEVWSSADGETWSLETAAPGWTGRHSFCADIVGSTLYIFAGYSGSYLNDVWSSTDGVTWTEVTPSAGFEARYGASSCVLSDRIFISGGLNSTPLRTNNVWRSNPFAVTSTADKYLVTAKKNATAGYFDFSIDVESEV